MTDGNSETITLASESIFSEGMYGRSVPQSVGSESTMDSKFVRSLGRTQPGHRLFARAKDRDSKLERKRAEKKAKDDEEIQELFKPRLVAKKTTPLNPTDVEGKNAHTRLYKDAKLKQRRDVARKQAAEMEQEKNKKKTYLLPSKATALYERGMKSIKEQKKKRESIAASEIPTFSPDVTPTSKKVTERGRSRTPVSEDPDRKKKNFVERLYNAKHFRSIEEKNKKKKEEIEKNENTFKPKLEAKKYRSKSVGAGGPVHRRLYEKSKKTETPNVVLLSNVDCTFAPDIAKSQKKLSAAGIKPDGTRVYERLYKDKDVLEAKRTEKASKYKDQELTFKPTLKASKVATSIDDVKGEERLKKLYEKGVEMNEKKRIASVGIKKKKETKEEEEERNLTFKPRTNWGSKETSSKSNASKSHGLEVADYDTMDPEAEDDDMKEFINELQGNEYNHPFPEQVDVGPMLDDFNDQIIKHQRDEGIIDDLHDDFNDKPSNLPTYVEYENDNAPLTS